MNDLQCETDFEEAGFSFGFDNTTLGYAQALLRHGLGPLEDWQIRALTRGYVRGQRERLKTGAQSHVGSRGSQAEIVSRGK
jgi:hypothetical protein